MGNRNLQNDFLAVDFASLDIRKLRSWLSAKVVISSCGAESLQEKVKEGKRLGFRALGRDCFTHADLLYQQGSADKRHLPIPPEYAAQYNVAEQARTEFIDF